MIKAVLNLTFKCNLRCSYCCIFDPAWDIDKKLLDQPFIDSKKWARAFREHPEITIIDSITGGEPLLQPKIDELINNIPQTVCLVSNISKNIDYLIETVEPERISAFTCSLHLKNEKFDENLLKLRDAGFNVGVNFVAYPEQIHMVPTLVRKYVGMGFNIHIEPYFNGPKEHDYKGEDALIMDSFRHVRRSEHTTTDEKAYRCNAGQRSLVIMPNGDVYPCTVYAWNGWYKMGNIFTGFDLLPVDLFCKTRFCMGCDHDKVSRAEIV